MLFTGYREAGEEIFKTKDGNSEENTSTVEVVIMPKKKYAVIAITIIFVLAIVSIFSIYRYRQTIATAFISTIAQRLDKEREEAVGEYNVLNWSDGIFQINHDSTGNKLELVYDDRRVVLLESIDDYKEYRSKLYIASKDGVAVISNDNIATIYIFDDDFKDYAIYRNGKQIIYSRNYSDEHIKYVDSVDEFLQADKKQLDKMLD